MPAAKWSVTEKDKIIKEIDILHDKGLSLEAACKKHGMSVSSYWYRKNQKAGKPWTMPKASRPKPEEKIKEILAPLKLGGRGGAYEKELAERTITLLERMWDKIENK